MNSIKPDLIQLRKTRDQYLMYVYQCFKIPIAHLNLKKKNKTKKPQKNGG
ncbi:UNVERIFIED_CONTAM: hypothetical protein FKN15_075922 [Acipenser sinensis]